MNRLYGAWTTELEDSALFAKRYRQISPERQRKIDRLRFAEDKRRSLAAALLLQHGLREAGITDDTLDYGENGKPFLRGNPLYFNLSHAGQRVLCAISDREVGCDVEQVTPVTMAVAQRFFCPTEYAALMAQTDPAVRQALFFRLWTLKESFLKITGLGLRLPMNSVQLVLSDPIRIQQTVDDRQYYFREYDLADGYRCAVCSLSPDFGPLQEVRLG